MEASVCRRVVVKNVMCQSWRMRKSSMAGARMGMVVVGVYVRAPRPDGKCCGERGCGRSCGRSRGHEPWGRDRVDIRNNGWRLHHYGRCGWQRRGHADAFCGQRGVYAFSAPSTDELDGMFDDAGLEERCDVLLDGFDAPGKRADERVLDRSRDRP